MATRDSGGDAQLRHPAAAAAAARLGQQQRRTAVAQQGGSAAAAVAASARRQRRQYTARHTAAAAPWPAAVLGFTAVTQQRDKHSVMRLGLTLNDQDNI